MKVLLLYRPSSEFARGAERFVQELERRSSKTIEIVDVDSPQGIQLAKTYDILDHPTFIATADDGSMQRKWSGKSPLPLIDDVAVYAASKV